MYMWSMHERDFYYSSSLPYVHAWSIVHNERDTESEVMKCTMQKLESGLKFIVGNTSLNEKLLQQQLMNETVVHTYYRTTFTIHNSIDKTETPDVE